MRRRPRLHHYPYCGAGLKSLVLSAAPLNLAAALDRRVNFPEKLVPDDRASVQRKVCGTSRGTRGWLKDAASGPIIPGQRPGRQHRWHPTARRRYRQKNRTARVAAVSSCLLALLLSWCSPLRAISFLPGMQAKTPVLRPNPSRLHAPGARTSLHALLTMPGSRQLRFTLPLLRHPQCRRRRHPRRRRSPRLSHPERRARNRRVKIPRLRLKLQLIACRFRAQFDQLLPRRHQ